VSLVPVRVAVAGGYRCRRCDGAEIGERHRSRNVWQCKACGKQTSVTAGTALHGLHKPRRAMGAPERQLLKGAVEVDEAFVGGRDSQRRGGRQHDAKAVLVGVAVEIRGRGSGRVRLQVLPNASQATLGPWVSASVAAGAIVHTDGWKGYGQLRALGFDHRPRPKRDTPPDQMLPLAHRTISNLKTWLAAAPGHQQ
jgi:ribosomal protein L37AE/L43A/transposase-like protein